MTDSPHDAEREAFDALIDAITNAYDTDSQEIEMEVAVAALKLRDVARAAGAVKAASAEPFGAKRNRVADILYRKSDGDCTMGEACLLADEVLRAAGVEE